jgi:Sulfotransferase domain
MAKRCISSLIPSGFMLPNGVIAGAPRCGTTSLFAWLAAHPEVCASSTKETLYLMDKTDPMFDKRHNYSRGGLEGYEAFFEACSGPKALVLEATPMYLYQRTALEVLSSLDPLPKIVFLFRKPSDRSYSHFHYMQDTKARIDRSVTFREFVDLAQNDDPRIDTLSTGDASRVIAYSRYADYLPAWLERFPETHLHFFLFEDLTKDPAAFAKTVADRLAIAPQFYDSYDFRRKNKSFRIRNAPLHRLKRAVGHRIPPRTRKRLKAVMAPAYRLNVDPEPVAVTNDELRVLEELERYFEPYNERLAALTGLELAAWR